MASNDALTDPDATAGVPLPPPILFLGGLAAGLAASRLGGARGGSVRKGVGVASLVTGAGIVAASVATFAGLGTEVRPSRPTTALATDGVYALTRNPIYVGFTFIYTGAALLANSVPAFTLLPVVLAVLDRTVVAKEERYLEARFGDAYRTYRNRVPRWF